MSDLGTSPGALPDPLEGPLEGPVEIVGAGLVGTSLGLALRRAGVTVWLRDRQREHVRTAAGLGAGIPRPSAGRAGIVVVAVPPAAIADVVVDALATGAVVTDVGSVKGPPLAAVAARTDAAHLGRYVGSHPMAGSEQSGPLGASAGLFDGRPWAVTAHVHATPTTVATVEALVVAAGATLVRLSPEAHDLAVARTSHVPHLMAALAAGQLTEADPEHLALSGQGLRDVTRVAAGDPDLYRQIIRANSPAVVAQLREVRRRLDALIEAVPPPAAAASEVDPLQQILRRGVDGTRAIPAKHGGPTLQTAQVFVTVPDTPGNLGRLFADVGASGVNVEDLRIDHDPGRPVGLLELSVRADAAATLQDALEMKGWATHR